MKRSSLRARRPSARVMPGRCGLRLAAEPHRPFLLWWLLELRVRRGQFLAPLGRLILFFPGVVELDEPVGGLDEALLNNRGGNIPPRRLGLALLEPFIAAQEQRLGGGVLFLTQQRA